MAAPLAREAGVCSGLVTADYKARQLLSIQDRMHVLTLHDYRCSNCRPPGICRLCSFQPNVQLTMNLRQGLAHHLLQEVLCMEFQPHTFVPHLALPSTGCCWAKCGSRYILGSTIPFLLHFTVTHDARFTEHSICSLNELTILVVTTATTVYCPLVIYPTGDR